MKQDQHKCEVGRGNYYKNTKQGAQMATCLDKSARAVFVFRLAQKSQN